MDPEPVNPWGLFWLLAVIVLTLLIIGVSVRIALDVHEWRRRHQK